MLNVKLLIDKLKNLANRRRFEKALRQIVASAPIRTGLGKFTVLSMVHHRDVDSYLLAIKSFCLFFSPQHIIVVTDPTITDEDHQKITAHINGIQFVSAENYRVAGIPQGGCWERLIAIAEYCQDTYVVQLDADTVTLSEIPEVKKAVAESTSFVLATEDGQDFISCAEATAWAKKYVESGEHIQILAEANMDCLADYQKLRYVRGCAGFSGFSAKCFNLDKLKIFSNSMAKALGDKWSAWGSEQFASNFMVSNSPQAIVLPHPKYCHPGREQPETVFLHFIGYVRFKTNRYARAARATCAALAEK
ncbi:MAG: hypothetical protein LBE62_07840 [Azonexus sp.]|jgi:hypothetical protein|nr:hypothetical protein [Azonexus sp.]